MGEAIRFNTAAICDGCGKFKFHLVSDGQVWRAYCVKCGAWWATPWSTAWQSAGSDIGGDKAVGGGGDEPPHLVPASEGSDKPGGLRKVR